MVHQGLLQWQALGLQLGDTVETRSLSGRFFMMLTPWVYLISLDLNLALRLCFCCSNARL